MTELDGSLHKPGRVIDDVEIHAFRHGFLQVRHGRMDVFGNVQRIGTGRLEHAHADRELVVEQRAQRIIGGAHFDARHIAQPGDFAFIA